MELGNLLGKLKSKEKEEPKKFLALVLTDEIVQAAVWHVVNGTTEIVATGSPVEWDGDTGTTTELVTAVDATISSATEGLNEEPNGVILGIPHTWTDKDGILGVKREFIKKIKAELELEPLGFVVITDSILSYLKMQEGTPTTSILIQVSRDELTLVLVRLGQIEAVDTIGRSDDVVEDVTEGIARFKIADNLPSRIILFNSMHGLDDIIQNLLTIDWLKEFNFLHIPKIEALGKDVSIRALAVAGGSEVAKSLGFSVSDPKGKIEPDTPELLSAEDIGFTTPSPSQENKFSEKLDFIDPDDEPTDNQVPLTPQKPAPTPFVMPKISLPKLKFPKFKFQLGQIKSYWWIIGGSLITVGLLIFWLLWFLPSAAITIKVTPKTLDQNVELTLSTTDSSINFTERIVPAQIESVSTSGEKMIETTGKKTVGDPAKGEVTIYNRTSAVKTFVKGTSLNSDNLKFTLDEDITVASKSAGSDYVDVPGRATVPCTASTIGTESNLTSGTEFTIQSFGKDSYVGKNDAAFTGGTSEEVQVVGKDDQKTLSQALAEELLESLKTKASESAVPGTGIYLIPDSAKIDSTSYSAKTGEAEKTVTGSLTLQASLLRYKTDDVTTLVNSAIDQAVPPGFVRANLPSTVDLTASNIKGEGESVEGSAKVQVALLPIVDLKTLVTSLKGKKPSAIEEILMDVVPGYDSALIQITPSSLPTRLKSIPLNPARITINIIP
ncbi:MAG: baseplate J/gp47 family protein [bacterium]